MPNVTAVILTHEPGPPLLDVLQALQSQSVRPNKIVLVDNGSTPDSVEWLIRDFEGEVSLVRLGTNLGVGAGHAAGWAYALSTNPAELVWCLEHDSVPAPDCLAALLECWDRMSSNDKRLGVVFPHGAADPDERAMIESTRSRDPSFTIESSNLIRDPEEGWSSAPAKRTTFNGPLISACVIREVGVPRSDFFVGQEDWEWSGVLEQRGVTMALCLSAWLYHSNKGNQRRGERPTAWRQYLSDRNRVRRLLDQVDNRRGVVIEWARALGSAGRHLSEGHVRAAVVRLIATRDGMRGNMGPPPARLGWLLDR